MTLIKAEDASFPMDRTLGEIEELLLDLKADVKHLSARVRAGEPGTVKEATRLTSEIRHWLKIAYELETMFHERQRKQAGIERGYAVDFDAARDQIRCRLDRLRRCADPGRLSG